MIKYSAVTEVKERSVCVYVCVCEEEEEDLILSTN